MLPGHFALASCTSMLHCMASVHHLLLRIALLHCAEHCVASVHCLLHRLASLSCTLHRYCALATCTGMLLCTASVHRLLHCIALRLRLQVRCYFWCRGCNCCMGSAGQALPPIIHMNKRVIPLAQQTLHVVASYVSCTAEILVRCRVGLRAARPLAKLPRSWSQLAGRLYRKVTSHVRQSKRGLKHLSQDMPRIIG